VIAEDKRTIAARPPLPASTGSVERLVLRWPPKIRREIGEWLAGALCGHGSHTSESARRRWKYLLKKLDSPKSKS
jgi:hypothetical protein